MNSHFSQSNGAGGRSDRPKNFRDRFHGKSSAEVLAELKDQFEKEREAFFRHRPFGDRDMHGFGESPFRSRFFDRPSRFSEKQPPEFSHASSHDTAPSAAKTSTEDPFKDKDSIPIKVIHEYTSSKPPTSSNVQHQPAAKQTSNPVPSSDKFQPPKKSASSHEVPIQPPRKPPVYQKSSSAGVRSVPVSVLHEDGKISATPTESCVSPAIKLSLEKIVLVENALVDLSPLIDAFTGAKSSKDYLYLDEMLTRNLIKLDDVETHGDEGVRTKRKACVHRIQKMVEHLELRSKEAETVTDDPPGGGGTVIAVEHVPTKENEAEPEGNEPKEVAHPSDQSQQSGQTSEERIYDPSDEGTSV